VRLVACLLSGATLLAQTSERLPWVAEPSAPWRATAPGLPAPPLPAPQEARNGLEVRLGKEGSLHVYDAKGLLKLRAGLPGRPLKVWRDGGRPVLSPELVFSLPQRSPFGRGLGAWPLGQADFRPALEGLLWVLEDGERYLSIIHAATSQVVHLGLPAAKDLEIQFLPDALEVRAGRSAWSLPWLGLLPQFIRLATPAPAPPPGTALVPFPRE